MAIRHKRVIDCDAAYQTNPPFVECDFRSIGLDPSCE